MGGRPDGNTWGDRAARSGNWQSGHWRRYSRGYHYGPSVGFSFGTYPYGYYDDSWGYAQAPYAEDCEHIRVRYRRANGRIAYRTVVRCYY